MSKLAPKKYGERQMLEVSGMITHELTARMDEIQARRDRERGVIDVTPEPTPAVEHRSITRQPGAIHHKHQPEPAPDEPRHLRVLSRSERETLTITPAPKGPPVRPEHHASFTDFNHTQPDKNVTSQQWYVDWVKKRSGQG